MGAEGGGKEWWERSTHRDRRPRAYIHCRIQSAIRFLPLAGKNLPTSGSNFGHDRRQKRGPHPRGIGSHSRHAQARIPHTDGQELSGTVPKSEDVGGGFRNIPLLLLAIRRLLHSSSKKPCIHKHVLSFVVNVIFPKVGENAFGWDI